MTSFKDREQSFENKYAHEEKLEFELEARTCKVFGLWAAEKIGLFESDAETYAKKLVSTHLDEAGFGNVLQEIKADFEEKEIEISDHLMKTELDKALEIAKEQTKEGS